MAGLIKRGNTWVATFYVAGQNVRKSTKVKVIPPKGSGESAAKLRRLAQLVADQMEAVAQGKQRTDDAVAAIRLVAGAGKKERTVREACESYQRDAERRCSGHGGIRAAFKRFFDIAGQLADLPLSKYTAAMAEDWLRADLDMVSGGTASRDRQAISAAFNRAIREGHIHVNPFAGLRLPTWAKNEHIEREILSKEQLAVVFGQFPGEWPDLVAVTLLLGGQRLGDMATLTWQHVDFERGLVTLRTDKVNRLQRCPMIGALRDLLERRQRDLAALGLPWVFPYSAARVAEADGKSSKLSAEFSKLLEQHGLRPTRAERLANGERPRAARGKLTSGMTFHSLRATAVTFLLDAGVPPELVRHIVGHDDPAIERRYYYRPQAATQVAALEPLAALIQRASNQME